METLDILINYNSYFEQYGIVEDAIRSILMGILKVIRNICNAAYGLYNAAYELLDFTEYGPIQSFLSEFDVFIKVGLIASLLIIAYIYIVDHGNRPNWIKNIFLAVIVVTSIGTVTMMINGMIKESRIAILNWNVSGSNTSIVDSTILNNSYDLLYMINNRFYDFDDTQVNNFSTIESIDIHEVVEPGDNRLDQKGKEIFSNYVYYDTDGNPKLTKIEKSGWLSFSETPYYYRWHINFIPLYIHLTGLFLALVIASFKVVQLLWELIVSQLLVAIFSGDITGSARLKKIITFLFNTYLVLFLMPVFFKIYELLLAYVNTLGFSSMTVSFFSLFLAFCLVDGPNIIQQLTGIDAGLTSGFGKIYAATHVANAAGKVAGTIVGGAASVGGFVGGIGSVLNKNEDIENSGSVYESGGDRRENNSGSSSENSGPYDQEKTEDYPGSNPNSDPYGSTNEGEMGDYPESGSDSYGATSEGEMGDYPESNSNSDPYEPISDGEMSSGEQKEAGISPENDSGSEAFRASESMDASNDYKKDNGDPFNGQKSNSLHDEEERGTQHIRDTDAHVGNHSRIGSRNTEHGTREYQNRFNDVRAEYTERMNDAYHHGHIGRSAGRGYARGRAAAQTAEIIRDRILKRNKKDE